MLLEKVSRLWPAVQGSLSEVRKPCIRKDCAACRRGDKHAATIFTYWQEGKQRCMYVPQGMVARMRQALRNGRELEGMMKELGPYLIKEYRRKQKR